MRLIDADALPRCDGHIPAEILWGDIRKAPTIEQVKPWAVGDVVTKVLNRLGRTNGKCSGVPCTNACPFWASKGNTSYCRLVYTNNYQKVYEIATKWLADHPLKPEPTAQERRKLQALAELGFQWFAVNYHGVGAAFTEKPERGCEAWGMKVGTRCINAFGLENQKFLTWEDDPIFTEVQ